jgi:hypothetical protein
MPIQSKMIKIYIGCFLGVFMQLSCKKLVSIPPPKNTLTTVQVFNSVSQAESAMAGIYTRMINGETTSAPPLAGSNVWSAGAVRLFAGLSSGELYNSAGPLQADYYAFSANKLSLVNSSASALIIWKSAYITIYGANSVIEGIAASTSSSLSEADRKRLTGEAKFLRAFAYFYLTNLFGDVPLALTVDFHKTINLPRAPQAAVYRQIIDDLKEAQATLRAEYTTSLGERIRPNKWAATAMLARAYLFTGDYDNAVINATAIINEQGVYKLETDLNTTFKTNSVEAIWQLKPAGSSSILKNATPEGQLSLPSPRHTGGGVFYLSNHLMNAFESGDKRRVDWVDSTTYAAAPGSTDFYPTKYQIGKSNSVFGQPGEYYMMLRLAEIFLIRAEAIAKGNQGELSTAIDDLNKIRYRAGLEHLPNTLTKEQVIAAVEKERQVELFAEWGHRWLDLKRTNRASVVLQTIPVKLPWEGDYQLLYPIPVEEIRDDYFLTQNEGYF